MRIILDLSGTPLVPCGKEIVDTDSLRQLPPGAIVVGAKPATA